MTTLWVDASSGASGDMLLGALLGAGVPIDVVRSAVDAVTPEPVTLRREEVTRAGFAATRCHVEVVESHHHRTWRDIRALLLEAPLDDTVRDLALRVFERLAVAEAAVHGTEPMDVHFHEVGALDAIADVVGVCAGVVALGADKVVVSPVAVGSGSVRGAHGTLPVPPPAVAQLLRGVPSYAGPDGAPAMELCTPTGAALLTTIATGWGPQPAMTTREVGVGAGGRDPAGHANVLRLLVGDAATVTGDGADELLVLETNVDDLDPRVWPEVITAVLAAGALDAWLTPILMKKGRPAHTFRALVEPALAGDVRNTIFRETSTIGIRTVPVERHALPRETTSVQVGGLDIPVKLARLDGVVVNAQPEYDDVVRAAAALDRPVADVLREATAASRSHLWRQPPVSLDLAALLLTFGAIFVVELPDKTFLATLVLATKYRPLLVWIGVGAAFAVQTTVAVLLGHAASFLPDEVVKSVALVMFLVGAVILVREGIGHQQDSGEEYADEAKDVTGLRQVLASFLILFAAEWGDLSQLLTISLVARYEAPVSVFIGALGALLVVSGLAVIAGRTLLRFVALHVLHYVGAGVCLVLATLTLVELVS